MIKTLQWIVAYLLPRQVKVYAMAHWLDQFHEADLTIETAKYKVEIHKENK